VLLLGAAIQSRAEAGEPFTYPTTPRDSVIDDYHGTKVADPYRWLEQTDSPRTTAWLESQHRLTSDYLHKLSDRESMHRRLTALWNYDRTEVPWREAGRLFYLRNSGREPQSVLYTQEGPETSPRLVLDPAQISPDGSIAVEEYAVAPDGRLLAYKTARGGGDDAEIHLREIATSRDLPEVVHDVLSSACWTHDAAGFFYVHAPKPPPDDPAGGASLRKQVRYHVLGQSQAQDRLILDWKAEARWVYCMSSADGRYGLFVAEKGTESEIYALDLRDPRRPDVTARPMRLLDDRAAFHTPVDIVGNTLYVRTNLDAPRVRIVALDLTAGSRAAARTIIPESREVILDAVVGGNRLAVHCLADVTSRLRLFELDGQPAGEVALPGIGAVGWPVTARPSVPELYFSFTSFLSPATVYRYDLRSGSLTPFRPPQVPFDPSGYETRQVFFTSKDGTRVPMFMTAAKNLSLDGSHPTMLTGYGGYGTSRVPSYEPDLPLWLERGGIYAVANLRGGGEYGEDWHRDGMLERKQNSFDDFIAAAEYLIAQKYTAPAKLAIYGHSNGGLLVGAVLTQRPELFAAAVANAGHYDMLRYHRFTIGAGWITEYGSPEDPAAFPYLRAYSPVHNVRNGICYPATLLLAADHDNVVVPSHAYKFAAALQAAQGCSRPILLRVARDASHMYASSQTHIDERTDLWAFVAAQLGASGSR
jgi:prolyl oligopeptidase